MLYLPVRKMRRLFRNFVLLCACVTIMYIFVMHSDEPSAILPFSWHREGLKQEQIEFTMEKNPFQMSSVENELHKIAPHDAWQLNFYDLPKRKVYSQFTEFTSANRDSSYLMAPDFSYHLEYRDNSVLLYEDFGPGCMYRNYLFPSLPTQADELSRKTAYDLGIHYVQFVIDDKEYKYTVTQMMLGETWPFIQPLNTKHPKVASGLGVYQPICYQKHAKVTYIMDERLPENIFDLTINCSRKDLVCPLKIYSGISRHKFPENIQVAAFNEDSKPKDFHAANLLLDPITYGPQKDAECVLQCYVLCEKCRQVIYSKDSSGVIKAMFFRLFRAMESGTVTERDWSSILVTMTWDNAKTPQVKSVPLGYFFGATGSLNTFKGALSGKAVLPCKYVENDDLPSNVLTAYLSFPMPFWEHAEIQIENIGPTISFCSQVLEAQSNKYPSESTGYFSANASFFMDKSSGYHTLLDVDNSWGHTAGIFMQIDNLVARAHAPVVERWAALQADPVFFIDGQKSASVLGTGREDWFSYAHGFAFAENTSYAFLGVPYAHLVPKGTQSWYCYRFHVLDPIPFHKSVKFIVEGIEDGLFEAAKSLPVEEFLAKKRAEVPLISHLVVYYSRPRVGLKATDTFQLGKAKSEKSHNFQILNTKGKSTCNSAQPFSVMSKRYLGNSVTNKVINRYGRKFSQGCIYTFSVQIDQDNVGVILRRESYSRPKDWNQKLEIYVDGEFDGTWLIPFGSLSDEYSLREEDKLLSPSKTTGKSTIEIKIESLTSLHDLSYTVLVMVR